MQQGRFRATGMMNHHPHALRTYSVASLITGQVGHFWKADPGQFSKAPKRVAVITNNGAWIDDPEYIAEAEKRVEEFLKLTDEMFLTCIDVSIAPSDHIVKNTLLTQRIDALRERYLRDSATRSLIRTFSDPTYCGEPYAKIFPGATIEFGGSSGVTVRETTS